MIPAVAVTGVGVVAPAGVGVDRFWDGVISGRSTFRPAHHFSTAGCAAPTVGYVPIESEYDPDRRLGRLVRFAAAEALADGHVDDRSDIVMVLGTTSYGTSVTEDGADPGVAALLAQAFAQRLGLHPASLCLANASASGATAIGFATELLACGDATRVLAVGADLVTPQAYFGLNSIRVLDPSGCRPFARDRRGIRPSEAAGAMLMETISSYRQRGASPRGFIRGYGANNMADNPARPGALSISKAISDALDEAAVPAAAIGYINVHGPGTKIGDLAELDALRSTFAESLPHIPINSSKSLLGHTQGAAGLVEALVALLVVQHGCIPPTHGLTDVDDPWIGLDVCTLGPRYVGVPYSLSVSCGLGGLNTAVLAAREVGP